MSIQIRENTKIAKGIITLGGRSDGNTRKYDYVAIINFSDNQYTASERFSVELVVYNTLGSIHAASSREYPRCLEYRSGNDALKAAIAEMKEDWGE